MEKATKMLSGLSALADWQHQAPVTPAFWDSTDLDIFLRFLSSALAFWAEVRLSASARLSTAIARKTLSRISQ